MLTSLTLESTRYGKKELLEYADFKLRSAPASEFEQSIFRFIQQWLDSNSTVTVTSSGTTGKAKSYQVKKAYMRASAAMTIDYFNFAANTNALLCLSPNFIAGKMMLVRAFESGMNLLTSPPSAPLSLKADNIDFAAMVPAQIHTLLQSPALKDKLNRVKQLLLGGSAIPASLERQLQHLNTRCYASFGMTETLSHIALRKVNGNDKSASYQILKGITLGLDDRGCLSVTAPNICAQAVVTNDLVELENASFKVLGRYDNLINSGGVKLSPENLEQHISQLFTQPFVLSALPDDRLGQKLVLVVEGSAGEINLNKLLSQCQQILTGYQKPKAIYRLNKLPRNANGKVLRKQLSETILPRL